MDQGVAQGAHTPRRRGVRAGLDLSLRGSVSRQPSGGALLVRSTRPPRRCLALWCVRNARGVLHDGRKDGGHARALCFRGDDDQQGRTAAVVVVIKTRRKLLSSTNVRRLDRKFKTKAHTPRVQTGLYRSRQTPPAPSVGPRQNRRRIQEPDAAWHGARPPSQYGAFAHARRAAGGVRQSEERRVLGSRPELHALLLLQRRTWALALASAGLHQAWQRRIAGGIHSCYFHDQHVCQSMA